MQRVWFLETFVVPMSLSPMKERSNSLTLSGLERRAGKVTYPSHIKLGSEMPWPPTVQPGVKLSKEHDTFFVGTLASSLIILLMSLGTVNYSGCRFSVVGPSQNYCKSIYLAPKCM